MNAYKGSYCIVTGGAGFIGQNLVAKLIEYGAHVVIIDNFLFGAQKKNVHPKAILIKGDVRDKNIFKKLPHKKYQYLFHFAAPSSTVLFKDNLSESIDITVGGFLNTIKFAAEYNIRYLYPSTGSLYNGISFPHHEKAILNIEAQNEYAKAKIAIEAIAQTYKRAVSALGLRILAGYGPGEYHKGNFQGVVYGFCYNMLQGKAPVIWGDGKQRRDFIFINDIVNVILTLTPNCKEDIVNIGTGTDISFNEVIKIINKYLDKPIKPKYIAKPKIYLQKTMADITLLRKYYKKEFTPIEEGIKQTIKSIKEIL